MNFNIDDYSPAKINFLEAHILAEMKPDNMDQVKFIAYLDSLLRFTADTYLKTVLEGLLSKIQKLTPREYVQLRTDILSGKVLFPEDYTLPFIENG